MIVELKKDASQTLLARVRDATGALLSGADVTATLVNKYTHVKIADQFLDDAAMTEVEGTPGTYACEIPSSFAPPIGREYEIILTISKGGNTVPIHVRADVLHEVLQ